MKKIHFLCRFGQKNTRFCYFVIAKTDKKHKCAVLSGRTFCRKGEWPKVVRKCSEFRGEHNGKMVADELYTIVFAVQQLETHGLGI